MSENKITSLPIQEFFVKCSKKCGTYRISRETAFKFLSSHLKRELKKRLRDGASGAELEFKDGCPQCKSQGAHEVTVSSLRRRIN